ncbi:MAG TPA: hypothetical protein VE999_20400 [Gemmataceae bacterium]|nr:hypothetical protein [Gemmataceae bacterium]
MGTLKYEEIDPVSHSEAEAVFESDDPLRIARTLIAIGLHDHDWEWVQQHGLRFLSNTSEVVVSAAILSLAHTARVNQSIDLDLVVPALQKVATDQRYAGKVQDAIDDIEKFVIR